MRLHRADDDHRWICGQLPVEQKLFEPQSGYFVVDSILKQELYVSVNGSFKNINDISFDLAGNFKLKYAK